ncbi:MAG: HNH endonuclease [Dehalococcoidales bacterium]|nr:HNH endonuclease [Dehalococcoidales bacterium]
MTALKMFPDVKDKIKSLYLNEKLTQREIGDIVGISEGSISHFLRDAGVTRSNSDARKLAIVNGRCIQYNKKEYLLSEMIDLYVNQKLDSKEVGRRLNVCFCTVRKYIKEAGVQRTKSEQLRLTIAKNPQMRRRVFGKDNPRFKGGRKTAHDGYILIYKPEHPKANKGYVREHVLIWEEVHNQLVPKGWEVHHLNGVTDDNRPENLEAMPDKKHRRVIPLLQQRIRTLESKVKLLEKALDDNQMMFKFGDN